jgi:hypothetical protein
MLFILFAQSIAGRARSYGMWVGCSRIL